MRRRDQVVVLDDEIVNRHHREIALQRLPRVAVIERHVDAELAARIEEAAPRRVLPDNANEVARRNSSCYQAPGLAVVRGLEDVWLEIVELIASRGNVGGRRIERRWLDR